MPRRPAGPWWNDQKQTYCVNIDGKRHTLSADHDAAQREFKQLMLTRGGQPFGELLTEYVETRRVSPDTREAMRSYARQLSSLHEVNVSLLTAEVVADCIDRPAWCQSTRRYAYHLVRGALKYAAKKSIPLVFQSDELDIPQPESRGESAIISPVLHAAACILAPRYLRDLFDALHDTGARPSEVLRVSATDIDARRSAWVLKQHKTAKKSGKPRVIYLTPKVLERSQQLAITYPTGPIYRGAFSQTLSPRALQHAIKRLCIKHKLPHFVPYGYRHTFATRALQADVSAAKVAALLGHSNTDMLFKHYAHLLNDDENMRSALFQSLNKAG